MLDQTMPGLDEDVRGLDEAAAQLGLVLRIHTASNVPEVNAAFTQMVAASSRALLIQFGSSFVGRRFRATSWPALPRRASQRCTDPGKVRSREG
ncbi:MAG: hypothetical protein AB7O56_01250 [Bauldia sp.]